jgi:hypothetical protein
MIMHGCPVSGAIVHDHRRFGAASPTSLRRCSRWPTEGSAGCGVSPVQKGKRRPAIRRAGASSEQRHPDAPEARSRLQSDRRQPRCAVSTPLCRRQPLGRQHPLVSSAPPCAVGSRWVVSTPCGVSTLYAGQTRVFDLVSPAQRELTRRGSAQRELTRPGSAQRELTRRGSAQRELTRRGSAQRELTRRGSAQWGLTRRGLAQWGLTRRGSAQRELTRQGSARWGLIRRGLGSTGAGSVGAALGGR